MSQGKSKPNSRNTTTKLNKTKNEKQKIEKGTIEKGKIRNQVSITSSFGIHNSSLGIQLSSLEIYFFQKIQMQTLDNLGTYDTSHKQTSRTLIIWNKLRCNCSSRNKKRCSLNLKIPLKIKNKNKFLRTSFGMHFSSFGIQLLSFGIHFSSFGIQFSFFGTHFLSFVIIFQRNYIQTSRTSIRCDKLRCNCSSRKEKRYSLKIKTTLKIINKCKSLRKSSDMIYTKILLIKKTLFSSESKSLMQKCFKIVSYIISATKYTTSFSND